MRIDPPPAGTERTERRAVLAESAAFGRPHDLAGRWFPRARL
jgi:hypothetical protein